MEQNQKTMSWLGKKEKDNQATNAPPINFNKKPMSFTNSAQKNMNIVPLEQTSQERMMNRHEQ